MQRTPVIFGRLLYPEEVDAGKEEPSRRLSLALELLRLRNKATSTLDNRWSLLLYPRFMYGAAVGVSVS